VKEYIRFVAIAACFGLLLTVYTPGVLTGPADDKVAIPISTEEAVAEDITQVNCKDSERLASVKRLFEKSGASPEDIAIEKQGGVENLYVRLKGQGPGTIVIGAHYDKSVTGCGAIDNWTGIVALAHVYKSLKDAPLQKSVVLVGFGKEEQGLLGSKGMLKTITKEDAIEYCAMINMDSLGMAAPQVADNLSSPSLAERTAKIAERMKMPFNRIRLANASADSVPFIEKKIPAVTICGLETGWERILHSGFDQIKRVKPEGVYLGYRLALSLFVELDALPCEASREGTTKEGK
jgi:hypothetical protein